MVRKIINEQSASFLKSQIEFGAPRHTKRALQELCRLYRSGHRIVHPDQLLSIENSVNGLIFTRPTDKKVRRWALNTIAQLGRKKYSLEGVRHALEKYHDDPQTVASAIAALYGIDRDAEQFLKKKELFPNDLIVLAALQRAKLEDIDVTQTRINIETATADILKLALIVVGLDRAPEHIFDPRHTNAEIVRAVDKHHDKIVSQYSVWAIVENRKLNINNLGIDFKDVETHPPNVRSWLFRLVAINPDFEGSAIEYIRLGIEDHVPEAREGLAIGLRDTYFDGLEALVLDWFYSEEEIEIRDYLLDHMVVHNNVCPSYENHVSEHYELETSGSTRRMRIEGLARKTPLYRKLKMIGLSEQDLFSQVSVHIYGGLNVTNTYKTGDIQGGAVSIGGDATSAGAVNISYNVNTIKALQGELSAVRRLLSGIDLETTLKAEIDAAIIQAQTNPNPENVGIIHASLQKARSALGMAASSAGDITKVIALIDMLSPFLR